jgi:hypothetical protein
MKPRRIVFFVKSLRFLRYFKSLLILLLERGFGVIVVFDASKVETPVDDSLVRLKTKFNDFEWVNGPLRTDKFRRLIIACRNFLNYQFLLRKGVAAWRIKRHFDYLPRFCRQWLTATGRLGLILAKSRLAEWVCRLIEKITPADPGISRFLAAYQPVVVLVSYRGFPCLSPDLDYLKAAKLLGLPAVAIVSSWDQPTTKSLIQITPDRVFVWNKEHEAVLVRDHRIPREKISVVGAPQFDLFFSKNKPFRDRADFCREFKIKNAAPFLLYVAASGERSDLVVREIAVFFLNNPEPALRKISILVRPYPGREEHFANLRLPNVSVMSAPADSRRSLVDDQDYFDAIHHSFVVVTLTSTALLDAAAADHPCVMLIDSRFRNIQSDEHLSSIEKSGAFYRLQSIAELARLSTQLMAGQDYLRDARAHYVSEFLRPAGVNRSAASVILAELEKLMLVQSSH